MASVTTLTPDEFRLLTCERPTLTRMTIRPRPLQKRCPLDHGRLQHTAVVEAEWTASPPNLSHLEALPIEIVHSVFKTLDLQSLTELRSVSRNARALVDSFPPSNEILKHCPDALRALLSTQMAMYFPAQKIVDVLCTQVCQGCGEFGPFLDLFTGTRQCLECVMYSEHLLSVPDWWAQEYFGLTSTSMRTLPTLSSVPGQYGQTGRRWPTRESLVRLSSAAAARSTQGRSNFSSPSSGRRRTRGVGRPHIPDISRQKLDNHTTSPYRFMPLIRFPYLDRKAGTLEWGVSCQACRSRPRDSNRGYPYWDIIYSAAGYMEHFQKCELSQIGRQRLQDYIDPAGRIPDQSKAKLLRFYSKFKF